MNLSKREGVSEVALSLIMREKFVLNSIVNVTKYTCGQLQQSLLFSTTKTLYVHALDERDTSLLYLSGHLVKDCGGKNLK